VVANTSVSGQADSEALRPAGTERSSASRSTFAVEESDNSSEARRKLSSLQKTSLAPPFQGQALPLDEQISVPLPDAIGALLIVL